MVQLSSVYRCLAAAVVTVTFVASPLHAQRSQTGDLSGTVTADAGKAVADATLQIARNDGSGTLSATTDATGAFRIRGLSPGLYQLSARKIGFHEANLYSLRIVAGQITEVRVSLTASPTQLSTVEVRVSSTSIDASTSELNRTVRV
jgi:hypothetical protein